MQLKYSDKQKIDFTARFRPLDLEERNRYCVLSFIGATYAYVLIPITFGKALYDNLTHKNLLLAVVMIVVAGFSALWFQRTTEAGQSARMKIFKHHLVDIRTLRLVTGLRFHKYRIYNCAYSFYAILSHLWNVLFRGSPGELSFHLKSTVYSGLFAKTMALGMPDRESDPLAWSKSNTFTKNQFLCRFDEMMGVIVVAERSRQDENVVKIHNAVDPKSLTEDEVTKEVRKYFTN